MTGDARDPVIESGRVAGYRVEEARAEDLDGLARLEGETLDAPWSRRQLAAALEPTEPGAASENLTLVARDSGNEIVAHALFQRVLDEAELLRIGVAPSHRRRGLGRWVLARGLERLAAAGVAVCHLEVAAGNGAALAVYRAAGFSETGRRRNYYPDGDDALLLRLGPPLRTARDGAGRRGQP